MIPSLRPGCVQRCSEKSTSFRALFWALEWNEKIFSPHKQALSERMRWAAVLLINQYLTTHIANICEYKFPRKRVPAAAACARHHDARATGNGGYGSIATNGRNLPKNEIECVKSTMCASFNSRRAVQRRKERCATCGDITLCALDAHGEAVRRGAVEKKVGGH